MQISLLHSNTYFQIVLLIRLIKRRLIRWLLHQKRIGVCLIPLAEVAVRFKYVVNVYIYTYIYVDNLHPGLKFEIYCII